MWKVFFVCFPLEYKLLALIKSNPLILKPVSLKTFLLRMTKINFQWKIFSYTL